MTEISSQNDGNVEITSTGTSNSFKIFAASFITGRSESEPIMIPTRGVTVFRKLCEKHQDFIHVQKQQRVIERKNAPNITP